MKVAELAVQGQDDMSPVVVVLELLATDSIGATHRHSCQEAVRFVPAPSRQQHVDHPLQALAAVYLKSHKGLAILEAVAQLVLRANQGGPVEAMRPHIVL